MQILGIIKFAVSGAVGIGASKIVGKIIAANVTPETLFDKITMAGGAWALGGMASKATKKYTDGTIDDVAKVVEKQVDNFKESSKLGRIDRKESTFEKEDLDPTDYVLLKSSGLWVNAKKYAKTHVHSLNKKYNDPSAKSSAAFIMDANVLVERGYLAGSAGKWVLVTDEQPDTITLTKNASGVWEEISVRTKS